VGSNPTRSISFTPVSYGIVLSLFLVVVGQIQQKCQCRIPVGRRIIGPATTTAPASSIKVYNKLQSSEEKE